MRRSHFRLSEAPATKAGRSASSPTVPGEVSRQGAAQSRAAPMINKETLVMRDPRNRDLDILPVTINNKCNLACPHCYLNMAGHGYISDETIETIFAPENCPATVTIVGMEPLYDSRSAGIVRTFARRTRETETNLLMVTNGLGLKHLLNAPENEIPPTIDISLDGGLRYYSQFRGNGKNLFPKIQTGAQRLFAAHPNLSINILHTLYAENTTQEIVTDMMEGARLVSPKGEIYFSPFFEPTIQKGQRVPTMEVQSLEQMLSTLAGNEAFVADPLAFFFVGVYNADAFGLPMSELIACIDSYGLVRKSRIEEFVPHLRGYMRVMFDGCAIRPDYSNHTRLTQQYKVPIAGRRLVDLYEEFKRLPPVFEVLTSVF